MDHRLPWTSFCILLRYRSHGLIGVKQKALSVWFESTESVVVGTPRVLRVSKTAKPLALLFVQLLI